MHHRLLSNAVNDSSKHCEFVCVRWLYYGYPCKKEVSSADFGVCGHRHNSNMVVDATGYLFAVFGLCGIATDTNKGPVYAQ